MAGKFWREAASLMVVGRAANVNSKVAKKDFELLFLKRNAKSSFMPSSYVFPGGVIEPSDFSQDWLDVFKKCGYKSSDLLKDFRYCRNTAPQPMIYTNKSYPVIPEVGFRIAAIREAFEECGLLLAHNLSYKTLDQQDMIRWQKIVHQDASQFVVMFQEFGGCPDVWKLYEWITWLTPVYLGGRRFDTAFFITFMEKIPKMVADDKEVVDVKVISPLEILKQWQSGALILPRPQLYELNRLLNIDFYEELKKFACERGKKGMDHYLPVVMTATNGAVVCLPGDDLYPDEPDYIGDKETTALQESVEELRSRAKNIHRMEVKEYQKVEWITNVTPKYGHLPVKNSLKGF